MKRKLLFVVNVDWFFLSHRLPIALEAVRRGYEVHVATELTGKQNELESHGLSVHPLSLNRGGVSVSETWRSIVQLWQIFGSVQPDLVHLVTIKPVLLGGLVARLRAVPAVVAAISGLGYVFMAHGIRAAGRRWLVGAMYRVAFGCRNLKVVFQNADDLRTLTKVANLRPAKVIIIRGSGVDLTQYAHTPLPRTEPVVVLAARLLADKGVMEFVRAARLLKSRGCNARFVLVGAVDAANPTSFSDTDIAAWVSEGVVEWWGHRTDMPKVLAASHLVVLPSYREGLPKNTSRGRGVWPRRNYHRCAGL